MAEAADDGDDDHIYARLHRVHEGVEVEGAAVDELAATDAVSVSGLVDSSIATCSAILSSAWLRDSLVFALSVDDPTVVTVSSVELVAVPRIIAIVAFGIQSLAIARSIRALAC